MKDRQRQKIVGAIIDELRECGNGTVTTIRKLLETKGYRAEEYDSNELREIREELGIEANSCNILLDWQMPEEGKKIRDLDFAVYNSRSYVKCPRCGSKNTARILYGMPCMSEELQRRIDDGKIVIGGCRITEIPVDGEMANIGPARVCGDCGKEFGKPPLIVARDHSSVEDYRDIVNSIEFVIRDTFGGDTKITIRKNENGAMVKVRERASERPDGEESETASGQILQEDWDRILNTLYGGLYLHEWRKSYDNRFIPDGPRWELRLRMTGRRQRSYHGSNSLTPYYNELINLMLRVF